MMSSVQKILLEMVNLVQIICEAILRFLHLVQVRKGLQQATLKLGKNEHGFVVVEKYVFYQHVARKELALMIYVHGYPLSMVDHIGFRKFCAVMQPLFKAVFRNTIKRMYWICMMCKGSVW
jgi:hypothetical protein